MRNTRLWMGALLAGGLLSLASGGHIRSQVAVYGKAIRAEMQQYRNVQREVRKAASDVLRAQTLRSKAARDLRLN